MGAGVEGLVLVFLPKILADADKGAMVLAEVVIEAYQVDPGVFQGLRRAEIVVAGFVGAWQIGKRVVLQDIQRHGIETVLWNDIARKRCALKASVRSGHGGKGIVDLVVRADCQQLGKISPDRKSTRLNSKSQSNLVCRLLL